ncbi:MAG: GGDEF domain-containing protein [Marinobacter sp.]|uniref:diguanylate cyclase n=1 Tax=Marinobacter sp. TaxID=50741 RepID=UPI00349FEE54
MIDLHLPTLLIMTVGVNGLLGGFMWIIYQLRNYQRCFVYWSLSCGIFALGCLMAGAGTVIDLPWLTVFSAHTALMLSPLMIVLGLRSFLGLKPLAQLMVPALAVWVLFEILMVASANNAEVARFLTALIMAGLLFYGFHLLGRVAVRSKWPVGILRAFMMVHACLMVVQLGVMVWSHAIGVIAGVTDILEFILVSHIVLATSTALAFPLLAFVQAEESLRTLAEYDELTQLYNRRMFLHLANIAFENCRQKNLPFTVLMIDLDYFKKINDTWGHATGDLVLQVVSDTLRRELRDQDIIGRMGGEELAIALPATAETQAKSISQRLRGRIEEDGSVIDGLEIQLSASIGGAHRQDGDEDFASMLVQADSALYMAKARGRNQVQFGPLNSEAAAIPA